MKDSCERGNNAKRSLDNDDSVRERERATTWSSSFPGSWHSPRATSLTIHTYYVRINRRAEVKMTFTPSAPMHVGFELNTELRFIPTNEGEQSLSIVTTIFLTAGNKR